MNPEPNVLESNKVPAPEHGAGMRRVRWKTLLAFLGPAYLVSVGYMDPGNWATDLAGGSRYGYTLIWVLLLSNLMAILLQNLSARLGIVQGKDLAQANREYYPRFLNFILYLLAELAIAACDLAEVLGMAVGLNLLCGIPLLAGVAITVLDTFLILFLNRLGMRKMEAFIITLIAIIGISVFWEALLSHPHAGEIMKGFVPSIPDSMALYITIGIIGATVMPHNLYLHSSLVQTRNVQRTDKGIRTALRMNYLDSGIALNLAFFVNAAILILAASVFYRSGHREVASIQDAHQLLSPLMGNRLAPIVFSIALIAAGQSSTVTGTLAGQIVMEGYLQLRINPWLRRLITRLLAVIPAVLVIWLMGPGATNNLLIFSQVLLSLQLGFAMIPLIHFVSDPVNMGKFVLSAPMKALGWLVALVLVALNLWMIFDQVRPWWEHSNHWWVQVLLGMACLLFLLLLVFTTLFPLMRRRRLERIDGIHPQHLVLENLNKPVYLRIGVCLDFSHQDEKVISNALAQGGTEAIYLLIHVNESASARIWGQQSFDYESRMDMAQLDRYAALIRNHGYRCEGYLGFNKRVPEIVRIVREHQADLLIMGSHGHRGLKDLLYGETVNNVRHEVGIPVLIVH